MISSRFIAECDLCGAREELRVEIGCYNEITYRLPLRWIMTSDREMVLCPECQKRESKETGNG